VLSLASATPAPTSGEGTAAGDSVLDWLLGVPLYVALVLVVAFVLRWATHRLIGRGVRALTDNSFARTLARQRILRGDSDADQALERSRLRADTVAGLLRSIASFVVLGGAAVVILARLGVAVAPLIASAGVVGIAIGFGAQSLVKDFITGIFMILEDQYGVGDVVDVGDAVGTVEDVGLRVTRLRDANGVVWYVPNGSITAVGNRSQGFGVATVDIPVPYTEDLERVTAVLRTTAEELTHDERWAAVVLDEQPTVAVESMTAAAVTVRALVRTAPGENLAVARELRVRAVAAFERAGIASPSAPTASG
jgi:small conductance mechanosensitive channel